MDQIALALVAFGMITTAAMALTEWKPLPIRKTAPKPQVLRKFLSCWAYALPLGLVAWFSGFVETPAEGWRGVLGVVLMSFLSTVTATIVVKGKKALV